MDRPPQLNVHVPTPAAPPVSRFWMFSLLIAAAVLTCGALFARYKLDNLRESVREAAETRLGTRFRFDAVNVAGLRGIRVDELYFEYAVPDGPTAQVAVPSAYVNVDLLDLLRGDVTVEMVQLDGATVVLERPETGRWFTAEPGGTGGSRRGLLVGDQAFRIRGEGCSIEIRNVVGDTKIQVEELNFDVAKLHESERVQAQASGIYAGGAPRPFEAELAYSASDDFSFLATAEGIAAQDVNVFLPASQHFVTAGSATPRIRVEAKPGRPMELTLDAAFEEVIARDQPEFLAPATGRLHLAANYDLSDRNLHITSASAAIPEAEGRVEGLIGFAEAPPTFDLHLEATKLPLDALVDMALGDRVDEYGNLELEVLEPANLRVHLQGTSEKPQFSVAARLAGANATFTANNKKWPGGSLQFGSAEVTWDSETEAAEGNVLINGGTVRHADFDLAAEEVRGAVSVKGKEIRLTSLNGEITGVPFVVAGVYDFDKKSGNFEVSGGMTGMEETVLADRIHDTRVKGAASVRGTGTFTPNEVTANARLDATQAEIFYNWFFLKPAGIGAVADVEATFRPNKSIALVVDANIASSPVAATLNFARPDAKWRLMKITAQTDSVDVTGVGRCLYLPYDIAGGKLTNANYEWNRMTETTGDDWLANVTCSFDEIRVKPHGGETPFFVRDGNLEVELNRGERNWGQIDLIAAQASTPRIGGDGQWFVDPRSMLSPELAERFPRKERDWTFELGVADIEVPPWKGTDFAGIAYHRRPHSGLESFRANVADGVLEGKYENVSGENLSHTVAKWTNIPAKYILDHLDFPPVLNGQMDGEVDYRVDRDDPNTRMGHGWFDIRDGQFSADYVASLLAGRFQNEMEALPPSLRFSRLQADVEFERDVVRTPHLVLQSEGLQIDGQGQFITDGDMNYTIQASITPDTAERIKPLRDAINLEGHRLSQQNIDLTFQLAGPLFNPQGTVEGGPPVSVTLVSGAFEVASEASKIIDIPRQILVDLLKLGGGLVGATK